MSKQRLEAFSDGVFAIAITLLVLSIAQPTNFGDLTHQLLDRWPSFAAYAVTFSVIGIMWLNHHTVFAQFDHADRGLVYCNLFLLVTVSFLPYPTAIFGEALRQGNGQQVAAVAYSITMALNAYAWGTIWLYGSRRRRLLSASFPDSQITSATRVYLVGVAVYTISVGIALLNAYACLAFHALMALFYALDPLGRRVGRAERTGR